MKIIKYITIILLLFIASQSYADKLYKFDNIINSTDVTKYVNKATSLSNYDMRLQIVKLSPESMLLNTNVDYSKGKNILIMGISTTNHIYTVNQTLDMGKMGLTLEFLSIQTLVNKKGEYKQYYLFQGISLKQYTKMIS